MGNLTCHLADLKIKRFGTVELRNEVYLVTLGMDLSLQSAYMGDFDTVNRLISDEFKTFNKFAIVGLSPIFHNIKRGDKLNIFGDGLLLYGPNDPKGKIMVHTAVMESDSKSKEFGKSFQRAIKQTNLFDGVDKLIGLTSLTSPQIAAISSTVRLSFETLLYFLKEDKDDVISTFHYSSVYLQDRGYAISPNNYWEVNDRYIQGHLKVVWDE